MPTTNHLLTDTLTLGALRRLGRVLGATLTAGLCLCLPAWAGHWEISGQYTLSYSYSYVPPGQPVQVTAGSYSETFNGSVSAGNSGGGIAHVVSGGTSPTPVGNIPTPIGVYVAPPPQPPAPGYCHGDNGIRYDLTVTPVLNWVADGAGDVPPDTVWVNENASAESTLVNDTDVQISAQRIAGLVLTDDDALGDLPVDVSGVFVQLGDPFESALAMQSVGSRRTLYHTNGAMTFPLPTRTVRAGFGFDPVQQPSLLMDVGASCYYALSLGVPRIPDRPSCSILLPPGNGHGPIQVYVHTQDVYSPDADNLPTSFRIKRGPSFQTIATVPAVVRFVPNGKVYFDAVYADADAVTNIAGFDINNCDLLSQLLAQHLWPLEYLASAVNDAGESPDSFGFDWGPGFAYLPASLTGLSISPQRVTGGATATGVVSGQTGGANTCLGAVRWYGIGVDLYTDRPDVVTIPPHVALGGGVPGVVQTQDVPFPIATGIVTEATPVTIWAGSKTARYSFTATLLILPCTEGTPVSITLAPSSVTGGIPVTGTVTLSDPAARGGQAITLTSDNPSAQFPPVVFIPEGAMSATFTATTTSVSAQQAVTVTGGYHGQTVTTTLTLLPPSP